MGLKILQWNANNLKNKLLQFKTLITIENIDIALISETKYQFNCNIPGFTVYTKNREDNTGGGVAILIKNNIEHIPLAIQTVNLEATAIKIKNGTIIASIYQPPNKEFLTRDLEEILTMSKKIIAAGDYNAKHTAWGNNMTNSHGRRLYEHHLRQQYLIESPNSYTHYPYNGSQPSIIDLTIVRNVTITTPEVIDDLDSDHLPIIFQIHGQQNRTPHKKIFNYAAADWAQFKTIINENLPEVRLKATRREIDEDTTLLTDLIIEAANQSIPKRKIQQGLDTPPQFIIDAIKEKRKIQRRYHRTRREDDRIARNTAAHNLNELLRDWRRQCWKDKLEKLDRNGIFSLSKRIRRGPTSIPTLQGPRGLIFSTTDKLELLADTFEDAHTITQDYGNYDDDVRINREARTYMNTPVTDIPKHTNPHEINNIIRRLNQKKAPGIDGVTATMIRRLPRKGIAYLTAIINSGLNLAHFPTPWKHAQVTPLPKPGKDKAFPQSYRPVSLLPILGKIMEKVIKKRIVKHIKQNNLQIEEQFGFRAKRSTTKQIVRLTDYISNNFNTNKHTGVILIDLEKAFDTVWHQGLIHKMIAQGFPEHIIKIIGHYLKNRTFNLLYQDQISTRRQAVAGVPQGSILGPSLFNLYTNDIPKSRQTNLAVYADDTAIYTASYRKWCISLRLQDHLEQLAEYFHKWKLKVNTNKTEYIVFSKKRRDERHPLPTLGGHRLEPTDEVKYLGVYLDKGLTFKTHIENRKTTAHRAINVLYPLIGPRSSLQLDQKLMIYNTTLKPLLLYACPAWSSAANSSIEHLQRIQNRVLRIIFQPPPRTRTKDLHDMANIPYIIDEVLRHSTKFYNYSLREEEYTRDIAAYRADNTPFPIKHKLPNQRLM